MQFRVIAIQSGGDYSYLIKKVKRLLVPYFVFAFGGVIPRLLLPELVNGSETIGESVIKILFHGGEYWFLYTLFIISALFPLIVKQIKQKSMVSLLGVIGLGILGSIIPNILCIQQVLYFMIFFFIGYLAKSKRFLERGKERVQKLNTITKFTITIVSIFIVLFCGYVHGKYDFIVFNLIEVVLGIVACVMIVVSFPVLLRKYGRYSKYSLSLYLFNGYFLVLSRTVAVNILEVDNPICIIAFNVVVDFYISYLVIKYMLSKLPIIRTIVGIV